MMRRVVFGLIILLAILHQDFWWWDDSETLVFGVLPIGLAYHAVVSLLASLLWAMAVIFCWPPGLDEVEDGAGGSAPTDGGSS